MPRLILLIVSCAVLALGAGWVRTGMALGLLAFTALCAWIAWLLVQLLLGRP